MCGFYEFSHILYNVCVWPYLWKETTVKTLLKQFCMHIVTIYSCAYIATVCKQKCFLNILTVVPFHISGHKCFARSTPLLQIRSYIHTYVSVCVTILLTSICMQWSYYCHVVLYMIEFINSFKLYMYIYIVWIFLLYHW